MRRQTDYLALHPTLSDGPVAAADLLQQKSHCSGLLDCLVITNFLC